MSKFSLESWILDAVNDTSFKGGENGIPLACTRIAVCHMSSVGPREIYTCMLDGVSSPEQIAKRLKYKADEFCSDIGGQQTCSLQAFFGDETEPRLMRPFMPIAKLSFGDGNGLATEGPTNAGQVQQALRHNEAVMQGGFQAMARASEISLKNAELMARMVETLALANQKLLAENMDAVAVVKEATLDMSDRLHSQEMAQLEHGRTSAERKKWLSMAPMLINTVLGREVFPASSADTALVEQIMDSLSNDDVAKLSGMLSPELMGPIMNRFTQLTEKREREKKEAEAARELGMGGKEYDQEVPQAPVVSIVKSKKNA